MADEPTNSELARLVADFRQDVREDFAQVNNRLDLHVLREVYAADKAAWELRMARLEREAETNRAAVRSAIYAAAGSVFATVAAGVILAMIVKGG